MFNKNDVYPIHYYARVCIILRNPLLISLLRYGTPAARVRAHFRAIKNEWGTSRSRYMWCVPTLRNERTSRNLFFIETSHQRRANVHRLLKLNYSFTGGCSSGTDVYNTWWISQQSSPIVPISSLYSRLQSRTFTHDRKMQITRETARFIICGLIFRARAFNARVRTTASTQKVYPFKKNIYIYKLRTLFFYQTFSYHPNQPAFDRDSIEYNNIRTRVKNTNWHVTV